MIGAKQTLTLQASAAKTATVTLPVVNLPAARGLHLIVDLTVLAAAETVTPKIQGQDPASGKFYDILVCTAISATGTNVYKVGPGIGQVAGIAAADHVPAAVRVVLTHSSTGSHTYSVGLVVFP